MKEIKKGMKFINGFMECEVLEFEVKGKSNCALIYCSNTEEYITVEHLEPWGKEYVWLWGHYFTNKDKALEYYLARK